MLLARERHPGREPQRDARFRPPAPDLQGVVAPARNINHGALHLKRWLSHATRSRTGLRVPGRTQDRIDGHRASLSVVLAGNTTREPGVQAHQVRRISALSAAVPRREWLPA